MTLILELLDEIIDSLSIELASLREQIFDNNKIAGTRGWEKALVKYDENCIRREQTKFIKERYLSMIEDSNNEKKSNTKNLCLP